MCPADERDLRARDRTQPKALRSLSELERAVNRVVVGEGERVVAELDSPGCELLRQRGTVEKRVRRVGVELYIAHSRSPPSTTLLFNHTALQPHCFNNAA